jgi:hypothetical protein
LKMVMFHRFLETWTGHGMLAIAKRAQGTLPSEIAEPLAVRGPSGTGPSGTGLGMVKLRLIRENWC